MQNTERKNVRCESCERLRAALQQFADLDPIDEYSGHRIVEMATEALHQQTLNTTEK